MTLCRNPNDKYLEDKTIFIAELSNGEVIYGDDDRPDSAWLRLKAYLKQEKLNIKKVSLKFRDHEELVGENVDGFYYARGVVMIQPGSIQFGTIVAGVYQDGVIKVKQWKVPELIVLSEDYREPNDSLIINEY